MRMRKWLVAAGFVFAVLTAYLAGQQNPPPDQKPTPAGRVVLYGDDFGFEVERTPGRAPGDLPAAPRGYVTGRFVVKVDGRWVEARPTTGMVRVPAR